MRIFRRIFIAIASMLGFPIILLIIYYNFMTWNWEVRSLPGVIEVEKVLASYQAQGGLLEGCTYASYEISQNFADKLKEQGLSYLSSNIVIRPMRYNEYRDKQEWRLTPIPEEPYLYAFGASGGCSNGRVPFKEGTFVDAEMLAKEPDNFYSTHGGGGGREGLIIISPKRKVAVYLYFG